MLTPIGVDPDAEVAAGVIGFPVRHSLSPIICQAAFDELGLDWVYAAFEVAPGDASKALDHMRLQEMAGLSVTMPHKADVAASVEELSPAAAALGAVNCVARDGDRLIGHNTDGAGFCDALLSEGVELAGISCAVLGAGGAARAVVAELARREVDEVAVIARRPEAAASAAALAGPAGTTAKPGRHRAIPLGGERHPGGNGRNRGGGRAGPRPRPPPCRPACGRVGIQPTGDTAVGRMPPSRRRLVHRSGDAGASGRARRANLDWIQAANQRHDRRGHRRSRVPMSKSDASAALRGFA